MNAYENPSVNRDIDLVDFSVIFTISICNSIPNVALYKISIKNYTCYF